MRKYGRSIRTQQSVVALFSWGIWARMPAFLQFLFSRLHAKLYELKFSKLFIRLYVNLNYSNGMNHIKEFGPGSGHTSYLNFQDFFTRKIVIPRNLNAQTIWPCDGLLCEGGKIFDLGPVEIKGELRSIADVFGDQFFLPKDGYFANIFLHNCDYHRIHEPIRGVIAKIVHIPGELRFLRPWFYKQPSLPALTNERVNIEIQGKDKTGHLSRWFLAIVGGPGVATIVLDSLVVIGSFVSVGQELARFRLGSTCCVVSPIPFDEDIGVKVRMGNPFQQKAKTLCH